MNDREKFTQAAEKAAKSVFGSNFNRINQFMKRLNAELDESNPSQKGNSASGTDGPTPTTVSNEVPPAKPGDSQEERFRTSSFEVTKQPDGQPHAVPHSPAKAGNNKKFFQT